MQDRFLRSTIMVAMAAAVVSAVISVSITATSAQAPAPGLTLKTPWGEPDLQGIWTDESDTPLQRSPRYANQEFFTEEQRVELDKQRSALIGRDRRSERGTEADVAGAYNQVFTPLKRTGARTSRIADPVNGRLPPLTPEAQKIAAAEREFRVALLQSTETCKNKEAACNGGKYDPAQSPRFAELPPRYNTARMNRHYDPEDATLAERCLTGGLLLRRGARARVATQHRHEREPAFAGQHPPMVRRLAWPLGGQYARDRRDELQPEGRFSGLTRESAFGRALDAHRAELARIFCQNRRSDGVDTTVDCQARVHQAERSGEQNLYRASLPRRKLWAPRTAAWTTYGRGPLCARERS